MPRRSASKFQATTTSNPRPLKRKASRSPTPESDGPSRPFKRGKSDNISTENRYLICVVQLIYAKVDKRERDANDNLTAFDDLIPGKKAAAPSSDVAQATLTVLYFDSIDRTVLSQSKVHPHRFMIPDWSIMEVYLFPWIFFNAHVPKFGSFHIKHVAYRIWEQLTRRGRFTYYDENNDENNEYLGRPRGWWWDRDGRMPRGYRQWAREWNQMDIPHDYHDILISALGNWWPSNLSTRGIVVDRYTAAPYMRPMEGVTFRLGDDVKDIPEVSSPENPLLRRTVSDLTQTKLGRPRREPLRRVETEQGPQLRRLAAAAPAAPRMAHAALPVNVYLDQTVEVANPKMDDALQYFGVAQHQQYPYAPTYEYHQPAPSTNQYQFSEQYIAQPLLPVNEPLQVMGSTYDTGFQSQWWPVENPATSDWATDGYQTVSGQEVLSTEFYPSTVGQEYELPEYCYDPHPLPTVEGYVQNASYMVPETEIPQDLQAENKISPASSQDTGTPQAPTINRRSDSEQIAEEPVVIETEELVASPQLFPYEQLPETTEPQDLPFPAEVYFEEFLKNDFELNAWARDDDGDPFRNQKLF